MLDPLLALAAVWHLAESLQANFKVAIVPHPDASSCETLGSRPSTNVRRVPGEEFVRWPNQVGANGIVC